MALSPVPDVGEVPRPAAGNDEQGVDPDIITVAHVAWRETFGRDNDAPQPPIVKRKRRRVDTRAGLHLDESQSPSAPGNDVYLASPYASAPR